VILHNRQRGFVLVVSLIFLLVMTVLAVTAIKRSILDEKVNGNLRQQNLALQAAETALRHCEKSLAATGPGGNLPLVPGTTHTLNGIKINPYPASLELVSITPPAPVKWTELSNWTTENAKTIDLSLTPHVAEPAKCMIEEYPMKDLLKAKIYVAYVITARGVGGTVNATVWLQQTIRVGNNIN
jgi:type IV pilus assembly protein PilX